MLSLVILYEPGNDCAFLTVFFLISTGGWSELLGIEALSVSFCAWYQERLKKYVAKLA